LIKRRASIALGISRWVLAFSLLLFITRTASSPVAADVESPFCSLPPDPSAPWLPVTPAPQETAIPSPRPASDCQFYRPAWQRFLVATQPSQGVPAFLRYPSFNQIFGASPVASRESTQDQSLVLDLSPRNIQRPNEPNGGQQELLDDTQAGLDGAQGGYLIDQHGRFVYYAIHFNPAFLQFLQNQNLMTVDGIKRLDPSLTFLGGDSDVLTGANTNVVEYKSAWMIVDEKHPPSNYFVVPARVPHYVVSGNSLTQAKTNGKPAFDSVKVALIALHVVFTLPGHPEMIWSTFEHVHMDGNGNVMRDNAPAALDNPSKVDRSKEISPYSFPLYRAHTLLKDANIPILDLKSSVQFWDGKTQSFTKGGTVMVQTSVYRPYPGSKTDGSKDHPDHGEDVEVTQINLHATTMFSDAKIRGLITDADQRQNYGLVGAIWLDQPISGANPSFVVKRSFTIDATQSTDDDGQPIAGEGRLGSTAMESFTEFEDGGAPNCFSCHDTKGVRHNRPLIGPAKLNVSHVLSKFLDTQLP
jgi:hypothetical protein